MKKLLLFLVVFCASILFATPASAKGVIIYSNGEELTILKEMPADFLVGDEGRSEHMNFGVHHQSFSLFWLPVWNYGEYKYALINDAGDTWIELSVEEAKRIGKEYNFDVPDQPSLPLLTQIGLKPVIVIVVLFIIYGMVSKNDDEEETTEGNTTTEKTE